MLNPGPRHTRVEALLKSLPLDSGWWPLKSAARFGQHRKAEFADFELALLDMGPKCLKQGLNGLARRQISCDIALCQGIDGARIHERLFLYTGMNSRIACSVPTYVR